jgi:hypothetical protein
MEVDNTHDELMHGEPPARIALLALARLHAAPVNLCARVVSSYVSRRLTVLSGRFFDVKGPHHVSQADSNATA